MVSIQKIHATVRGEKKMKKREIERHRKTALQFASEGKAYIHAEYNEDGQSLIVSGEAGVLLVLVRRLIARLAKITNLEEDEVYNLIKESEDDERKVDA